MDRRVAPNVSARTAAVLLAAEGLAVAAIVVWQIVALVSGDTGSVTSAIALIVLTLVGAVLLIAFAAAVWRGESWGRSGGIVAQLLILAVALGAATGAYAHPITGLLLALPAVATFVLLVLGSRRRTPPAHADDEASGPSRP